MNLGSKAIVRVYYGVKLVLGSFLGELDIGVLPTGFTFLIDSDGKYILDRDNNYIIVEE